MEKISNDTQLPTGVYGQAYITPLEEHPEVNDNNKIINTKSKIINSITLIFSPILIGIVLTYFLTECSKNDFLMLFIYLSIFLSSLYLFKTIKNLREKNIPSLTVKCYYILIPIIGLMYLAPQLTMMLTENFFLKLMATFIIIGYFILKCLMLKMITPKV